LKIQWQRYWHCHSRDSYEGGLTGANNPSMIAVSNFMTAPLATDGFLVNTMADFRAFHE
jgi:hypothetical protein